MKSVTDFKKLVEVYLPANSLRARFATGLSWVVVGSLIRQGTSFVTAILVARILGVAAFGELAIIQSTVLMLADIGQSGLGLSSTRYIASLRTSDCDRTGRIIGFSLTFICITSLTFGLVLLLFSPWITEVVLPGSNLSLELKLASGWITFEMINLLQIRMLAGLEAFRITAFFNLCQALLLLPIMIFGAFYGGVEGALVSFSIISVISCAIGQVILRRECDRFNICIQFRNIWGEREILRMSVIVWFSGMAMNATNWLVGIFLARQPSGIFEFGLFNAANRFQNILLFLPTKMFEVIVPVLSNLQAAGNQRGFNRALISMALLAMGISVTGAVLIVTFSGQFMSWYGAEFAAGSAVLKIMALGCVASSVWIVATAGLWAAERSRQMFMLDVLRGIILVTICAGGMAVSAQSLAIAYLISYSIGLSLLLVVLFRYIKQPWTSDKLLYQRNSRG